MDRLIAASFLSLSKTWCTPRRALTASLWIAVVLALLNVHFLYFVDSDSSVAEAETAIVNQSTLWQEQKRQETVHHATGNVHHHLYSIDTFSIADSAKTSGDYLKTNATYQEFIFKQNMPPAANLLTSAATRAPPASDNSNGGGKREPVNKIVYRKCFIKSDSPRYRHFFIHIFPWIDASAQVIFPFIIMVVCNINIIHKVLLTKNRTKGKNLKRLRKIKGMCVMIVSVSIIFFILEAPVLMFIVLLQGDYIEDWPHIDFVWTIVNLMMHTNHVINFFSYCMTGTKFRRELLRLLYLHKLVKFLSNYKSLNLFSSTTANNLNSNWRSQGTTVRHVLNRNGAIAFNSRSKYEQEKRIRFGVSEMDESNIVRLNLNSSNHKKLAASIYADAKLNAKRRMSEDPSKMSSHHHQREELLKEKVVAERKRQSADDGVKIADKIPHLELQRAVSFRDETCTTDPTRSIGSAAAAMANRSTKATILTNRIIEKRNQLADNALQSNNYDQAAAVGWTSGGPRVQSVKLANGSNLRDGHNTDQPVSFFRNLRNKLIGSKRARASSSKKISSTSTSATVRRDDSTGTAKNAIKLTHSSSNRVKNETGARKCLNYDDIDIEIDEDDDDI